jgi:CheY-like chemotaxis protein
MELMSAARTFRSLALWLVLSALLPLFLCGCAAREQGSPEQSGREAVERIRAEEEQYDLVFMDHMMPGMDGETKARVDAIEQHILMFEYDKAVALIDSMLKE